MSDVEFEFESAAEFLTRKRGRVKAKWVAIPVATFWLGAFVIAVSVGLRHRPHLVPFTASLYGCTLFFVHAYMVAWRSGSIVWRYGSLFIAVGFYAILSFLHADDAGAWLIYSAQGVTARPPEPALFVAVVLNVISGIALLVHGFFLGLGSRTPTPTEMGLPVVTLGLTDPAQVRANAHADEDAQPDANTTLDPPDA